MTFKITKASDFNYSDTMVFNSLAELMAFINEEGKVVIYAEDNEIMIYDDYIE